MSKGYFAINPEDVAALSTRRVESKKESGCATEVLLDEVDREALLSVNADIWTRAGIIVAKSAEVTLDELSTKLGVPYRSNGLEIGKTWNVARTVCGMALATLPKGWE